MVPLESRREIIRFAFVGAAGFAVDGSILVILFQLLDYGVIPSRLISFSTAATVTWLLNRLFTFSHRKSDSRLSEWARYVAVNTFGAALNLGIFLVLMKYLPKTGIYPLLALGVAALIALLANFLGSKYIAFHSTRATHEHV